MINELPIAILGFGKTGVSVAEYLHKKNKHFYVFENNETVEKLNQFNSLSDASKNKIFFGNFDRTELYKVQYIVQSPGIALSKKIKDKISKNNIKIVSDIDIFMKNYKSKVIAITGSNGKTTVTELLNYVLNKLNYKSVSCGNNGIPILSIEHCKYDYICLEVSSYQLEISGNINSDVAFITNITPDHIERHGSFEIYKKIKYKIFEKAKQIIIDKSNLNIDYSGSGKLISFGISSSNSYTINLMDKNNDFIIYYLSKEILKLSDINLIGYHNLKNVAFVLCSIIALGLDVNKAAKIISKFKPLPHRMEYFYKNNNFHFINDSKSTNIESTLAALRSFESPIVLILGGRSKTDNFSDIINFIKEKDIKLIVYGDAGKHFENYNESYTNFTIIKNLSDVVNKLKIILGKFDQEKKINILFSPACSSFDQFENYEKRGEFFKKIIKNNFK